MNGSVSYNSAAILVQGRQAGFMSSVLAVTKEFLKDNKANLSFTISNPFQKDRVFFTEVNGPTFYQKQQSSNLVRKITLAFNYRFGKLKEAISRKKRGINNDDLKVGN